MPQNEYTMLSCSVARTLDLIGDRWTLLVVRDAFYGVRKFADFAAHLGAPRAVVSARLKDLVQRGVLERRRYSEHPPRDEYVLTDTGVSMWPVIYAMQQWGDVHLPTPEGRTRVFRHADCGAELDPYGWCRTCEVLVAVADIELHPGPGATARVGDDRISRALLQPHRLLEPL